MGHLRSGLCSHLASEAMDKRQTFATAHSSEEAAGCGSGSAWPWVGGRSVSGTPHCTPTRQDPHSPLLSCVVMLTQAKPGQAASITVSGWRGLPLPWLCGDPEGRADSIPPAARTPPSMQGLSSLSEHRSPPHRRQGSPIGRTGGNVGVSSVSLTSFPRLSAQLKQEG